MYALIKSVSINQLLTHIVQQARATTGLEWLAFVTAVAQVWLALKNKRINFYAGLISVVLYTVVFYRAGLYAESLLNLYYVGASIAGLFYWQSSEQQPIAYATKSERLQSAILFFAGWLILYMVLRFATNSNVPALDAFVSAMAWAGTFLLIRRRIENWWVLNISNIIGMPLQFYKGLELTSLLTLIYIVLAIRGHISWTKTWKENALHDSL